MAAPGARKSQLILLLGLVLATEACARADIVFLLQKPGRSQSAFFELAAAHYRPQEAVVLVVDSARSLLQVRELLQRSTLRGPEPWGNIVLVAHGSRWTGLSVPIFDDQRSPDPAAWRRARERGEFVPLSQDVVDQDTHLRIDSCGLGARPDLLRELATLLGGDIPLQVEATREQVEFRRDPRHPDAAPTRQERPYGAQVRPRSYPLSAARILADGSRQSPIEFSQPLLNSSDCADVDIAGQLRPGKPMATALRDYGLRRRDLHFDVDGSGSACTLRARGVLIVAAEAADWPLDAIESTVVDGP